MHTVIGLDIGGTNARVRARSVGSDGRASDHALLAHDETREISSVSDVGGFVTELVARLDGIDAAVVAVAGPVAEDSARMTNWPGRPRIACRDLVEWGLPADTLLLNDLVAGAHGVLAVLEARHAAGLVRLGGPQGGPVTGNGHLVYTAPGTGLGAATLVACRSEGFTVVGCESQHTASTPPAGCEEVHDRVRRFHGRAPTWEDVVSGTGLVTLEALLSGSDPLSLRDTPPSPDRAGEVALAASSGDLTASEALRVFYAYLARFSQALALGATPCEAVIVGGATTRANMSSLQGSGFETHFTDNGVHSRLLGTTRLFAIAEDTNLDGCVRLATRRLSERPTPRPGSPRSRR